MFGCRSLFKDSRGSVAIIFVPMTVIVVAAVVGGTIDYGSDSRTDQKAHEEGIWPPCLATPVSPLRRPGLVDSAPQDIAIAPDLLGHASLQTTQKHYILAPSGPEKPV